MTSDAHAPTKLEVASTDAAAKAREQAGEYESLFADVPLELDDGDILMIPPHPNYGLLDDDKMEEWNRLLFEVDTEYEREEDIYIPEQTLDGGVTLPASTQRGDLKTPYRRVGEDGKSVLVSPPHTVRIAQIALGPVDYAKLRAGGKSAKDVFKIWGQQSLDVRERQQRDSKSPGSPVALAAVPEGDSE